MRMPAALQSLLPELLPLLQAWRSLCESEHTAIESSEWEALKTAQAEKKKLQSQIDAALARTGERPMAPGPSHRLLPPQVAELVSELKRLEQENRDLLDQKLSVARSGMVQVNASVRHLRQVHQAYGQNASGNWQSYS